jgi:hypothetical protein
MSSSFTSHTAQQVQGGWELSWLPGQVVTREQAVAGMRLAESIKAEPLVPGDARWPLFDAWAAELDMQGPDAVVRASAPLDDVATDDAAVGPPVPMFTLPGDEVGDQAGPRTVVSAADLAAAHSVTGEGASLVIEDPGHPAGVPAGLTRGLPRGVGAAGVETPLELSIAGEADALPESVAQERSQDADAAQWDDGWGA